MLKNVKFINFQNHHWIKIFGISATETDSVNKLRKIIILNPKP